MNALDRRSEPAPAKVNLFLHVIGKRPDGYHLLDSLAVFAALADEVGAAATVPCVGNPRRRGGTGPDRRAVGRRCAGLSPRSPDAHGRGRGAADGRADPAAVRVAARQSWRSVIDRVGFPCPRRGFLAGGGPAGALVQCRRHGGRPRPPGERSGTAVPAIRDVLATIAATPGCFLARMSGSGATCFGLYGREAEAKSAAATLDRPDWWRWGGGLFG